MLFYKTVPRLAKKVYFPASLKAGCGKLMPCLGFFLLVSNPPDTARQFGKL